jgi:hypothetical protein
MVDSITFEKLKLGFGQRVTFELLQDERIDWIVDEMSSSINAQITGFIYKRDVESLHVQYPRDWWQALKERWFPSWLIDRFPVAYHCVDYDVLALYPELHRRYTVSSVGPVVFSADKREWFED